MYQRIADCTTDGVCIVDTGHRILFANRQFATMLDMAEPDLLLGQSARELVAPEYHSELNQAWVEMRSGLPAARDVELTTAAGARLATSLTACPYYEGHNLTGTVVRVVDIRVRQARERALIGDRERAETALDDFVRAEDERTQLETQLQRSQRLEALGKLTGGVAHDFNNLLTVICSAAETLTDEYGDRREVAELGQLILEAAEGGAALISRLLAYARRQPLEPRAVEVDELVTGMEMLLRRTLGAEVETVIVCSSNDWRAMADPSQLETAILNLAVNARDAMSSGGTLTIETANVTLDDAYADAHVEVLAGNYVLVAVSDTGVGMEAHTADRAFDPFFTTKGASGGTGLGLSMVYGFAKQSGGHVKIYSEPGVGTCVKLFLPRTGVSDPTENAGPLNKAMPGGSEHILVVEDDPMVRRLVEQQLQSLGYRVTVANDGPHALELLDRIGPVDLMFTDVVMPRGMSGRQLAEAATKRFPGLPILYTSGYTENAIVHNGRLDQGVDLLTKPYRRRELALRVRKRLDESPRQAPSLH